MRDTDPLTIGEVATRAGVATSKIRFYERAGLLTATRSVGNQRRYARHVLRRLAFIRAAQAIGLSLDEIGAALSALPDGRTPTRADWERLSGSWRARLDAQIDGLVALRDGLTGCIGCGCLSLKRCALYNAGDLLAAAGPGARLLPDSLRPAAGRPPVGRPPAPPPHDQQ